MTARRILLLNPNTDPAVTRMMVSIAAESAPEGVAIAGATVATGAPLILDEPALAQAARAVEAMAPDIASTGCDGVVVSAFGDPGMAGLRRALSCPVTGLAEASMTAAAEGGRRFCVVTTTPDLASSIDRLALAYGHGALFAGTFCTEGDPRALMGDEAALARALHAMCETVVAREGVEAIIIGGGPLALAARRIRERLDTPLVEPVREAVAELARRITPSRREPSGRPAPSTDPASAPLQPSASAAG